MSEPALSYFCKNCGELFSPNSIVPTRELCDECYREGFEPSYSLLPPLGFSGDARKLIRSARLWPAARNPANRKQRLRAKRIGMRNFDRIMTASGSLVISHEVWLNIETGLQATISESKDGKRTVEISYGSARGSGCIGLVG